METLIDVKDVVKKYFETTAIDNVSFSVQSGECFGILGPNGAGKTTMVKMLYNLTNRTKGYISVFGLDPEKSPVEVKYRLGIVPQEDNLDSDLNVMENLTVYSNYFGLNGVSVKNKIDNLLDLFELRGRENMRIDELSGGMKRRLVIIRALINDPIILFLDEPTTGLDPQARHLIWDKLRELQTISGITIILTTHYMEEASQLCDRLMILNKGKVVEIGNPHKLLEDNFEKYVLETEVFKVDFPVNDIRYEVHGNRLFFYSNHHEKLFSLKECVGEKFIVFRNSTLEDVFLKLTGRQLDE